MTPTSISFPQDPEILRTLTLIDSLASERACYLVGGAIRDGLLDRSISDLDFAFDGDAPELARAAADALGGHYALLDDERGTARVLLDQGHIRTVDVIRLRGDIKTDLAARDLTIDAMAAHVEPLARGEAVSLIDPHGGARDAESRTVRLVAEQALIDDPLRLLRAVRLATELEFELEPSTEDALRRHAGRINESAAERIRDEIVRCFAAPSAVRAVRLMDSLGLVDHILPEVTAGRGVTQPKEHYYEVFEHNVEAVAAFDVLLAEQAPPDDRGRALHQALWEALAVAPQVGEYLREEMSEGRSRATILKLTALLHDVAKPETRSVESDGRIRFFGHADLGAETARRVLRRLRFSRHEVDFVSTMIESHLRPGQLGQDELPTRRAIYRFFRDTGDAAEGVLLLSLADALAARGPRMMLEDWRECVAYIAYLLSRREDEAVVRPLRLLDGREVMEALSIQPGREVGRLLAALEEAQAAGEVTTREDALKYIRGLESNSGPEGSKVEGRRSRTEGARRETMQGVRKAEKSTVAGSAR